MNITDKQAVEAAGVLREYCRNFGDRCGNECPCVFNYRGEVCNVETGATPDKWHIPTLPAEPEPPEPDKPYLCKLFGVGVGERFDVLWEDGSVWIKDVRVSDAGGLFGTTRSAEEMLNSWVWAGIIEIADKHPDRIRRKPKAVLTEDGKAIVRWYIAHGLEWLAMDKDGNDELWAYADRPRLDSDTNTFDCISDIAHRKVPAFLFHWATHEGSPYYLPDLVREEQA